MSTGRANKFFKMFHAPTNKVIKLFGGDESKTQPIKKIPQTIISISISDFLKSSEIAFLSQTSRFFNQTLSHTLLRKKEKIKKGYDDATSIDRLFSDIDPMGKMTVGSQKAHAIGMVITQFVNEKKSQEYYTNYHDPDPYTKLILNHAFDLDKKNIRASQLGRYHDDEEWRRYLPFLNVETYGGKDCLQIGGLEMHDDEVEYLAETFRKYYSTSLNVQSGKRNDFSYISFDLKIFLKDVLPVILGLASKPLSLRESNQKHCCIN